MLDHELFDEILAAAKADDAEAQNEVGCCYMDGTGVDRNEAVAFSWFAKSAKQGNSDAQFNLGLCYMKGSGAKQNIYTAAKWFTKAGKQGNSTAQEYAVICLMDNFYDALDFDKQFKIIRSFAKQECPAAQWALGVCYEKGRGTEQNIEQAVLWYRKSAKHGYMDGRKYLNTLLSGSMN